MKALKKQKAFLSAAFLSLALCSCQALKRAAAPIVILSYEPVKREFPGVEFVAANLSGRPLQGASFRLALSEKSPDQDEEDFYDGAFYEKTFSIEGEISPDWEEKIFVPFEEADPSLDEDEFEAEVLYSGDESE